MSEMNTKIQQAEEVRRETISILDNLAGKAEEYELPKPPKALGHSRQELEENTYQVLVVGEAKRGKSSFINALIGQYVLPTDVRVATSQVFNVRPAESEAYRLRFEDGSAKEVTLEDLPRYGSQVLEDTGEKPRLDQIIRWIEVDTPNIRFLPKGVSLLDTPGLGALYAAHIQITQRFVPEADAVIFVVDSEKQIVQSELDFIETILGVTSNIFFIQTKIDLYDEDHWQDIRRRDREILEERFGERLTDTNVWPISSTLLLSAASSEGSEDAEEDLEDSRHAELEAALRAFLFRVSGWSRSAEAILVAETYSTALRTRLVGRQAALREESKEKQAEVQEFTNQRKEQFQAEWGRNGVKRRQLLEDVRKAITVYKLGFMQALRTDSEIAESLEVEIDALASVEEANEWSRDLHAKVLAAASEKWRQTREQAEARCAELCGDLLRASATGDEPLILDPEEVLDDTPVYELKVDITARIDALKSESYRARFFTKYLPGPLKNIASDCWAFATKWGEAPKLILKGGKNELLRMVREDLVRVQQFFTEVDVSLGRLGIVEEYFSDLQRRTSEGIETLVKEKLEEAKAEVARLQEESQLSEEQRRDKADQIGQQLNEWDKIGEATKSVMARLQALDQPRSAVSTAEG